MSKKGCLNCEDRCIGCHANCIYYLNYKKENDKRRALMYIEHLIDFRNKRVAKYGK